MRVMAGSHCVLQATEADYDIPAAVSRCQTVGNFEVIGGVTVKHSDDTGFVRGVLIARSIHFGFKVPEAFTMPFTA